MLASLVGADFFFDSLGAYYAFSNELYGEAALYTVAASLPGFSSGMRRALTDGGAYALKTVQGTYVYRMKGVLATAPVPPFGIKDAFSQFTKSFLNTGSFRRASKYKTQTEFVKALEEGILANEDLARRLNRSPKLVDDYNQGSGRTQSRNWSVRRMLGFRQTLIKYQSNDRLTDMALTMKTR